LNDNTAKNAVAPLTLAALGVVYGDIGTSPLYAIKEVFSGSHHPVSITPENVLGILSLIFWSLIVVVSIKYVVFILRADNKGEGGIMALMALLLDRANLNAHNKAIVIALGLFGAALFYGDGAITPAISVLSAIEGLEVATPAFKPYVIPITIGILVALFAVQKQGTAAVGVAFGPITAIWFLVLAVLGIVQIALHPSILAAASPTYAVNFFSAHPCMGFFSLGAVFLAVTGAEALYADMGHFGRLPIRLAWFAFVLPALLLNYFGQGALLLENPGAIRNPFYLMAPEWALYLLVGLAAAATVIASQAVISGVYSMTQQAIQLGFAPHMAIQYTSASRMGQIYMPGVNWALLSVVIGLVLMFKSSTNLAAAYGIAVTGTMVITTSFAFLVAQSVWRWSPIKALAVFAPMLFVDIAFLAANAVKIRDGGWFPLAFGVVIFILLATWKNGRARLNAGLNAGALPLCDFIAVLESAGIATVQGKAIFMTPEPDHVPNALLHNLKHNKVLHETNVIASVTSLPVPRVPDSQRVLVERLNEQFYVVKIFYGFTEQPDVPAALEWCDEQGLALDPMQTSFFLGRETVVPKLNAGMAQWREKLFVAMFRNSRTAASYFKLPPNRVVELGAQVVL
jgi:KUP system potassium uptake protein